MARALPPSAENPSPSVPFVMLMSLFVAVAVAAVFAAVTMLVPPCVIHVYLPPVPMTSLLSAVAVAVPMAFVVSSMRAAVAPFTEPPFTVTVFPFASAVKVVPVCAALCSMVAA